jgi:hypothetical protein
VAELLERVREAQKSEGLHLQTALSELTSLGKGTGELSSLVQGLARSYEVL